MSQNPSLSYKDAGVNIDAQDEALSQAKEAIRSTFTEGVVSDVGLFGGLFDLAKAGCEGMVLVASADGVGTKLDVAKKVGVYDTVGQDLVNHCVDDILVQGARPLFFMDYVGTGQLDPTVVSELIGGCAIACRESGVALLGGETAEMPGLYAKGDFDLVGFVVGAVDRDKILDGSRVEPGQTLLGLTSSGLHTNGFSLARKIFFERMALDVNDHPTSLGGPSVGEALLAPHRCYYPLLWPLLEERRIAAMAHITGGGLVDNLPRILGSCDARIDLNSWERPALFSTLVEEGGLEVDEAHRVFNMGIGMVLMVDTDEVASVKEHLESAGETVLEIGCTEAAAAESGQGRVRWA